MVWKNEDFQGLEVWSLQTQKPVGGTGGSCSHVSQVSGLSKSPVARREDHLKKAIRCLESTGTNSTDGEIAQQLVRKDGDTCPETTWVVLPQSHPTPALWQGPEILLQATRVWSIPLPPRASKAFREKRGRSVWLCLGIWLSTSQRASWLGDYFNQKSWGISLTYPLAFSLCGDFATRWKNIENNKENSCISDCIAEMVIQSQNI